MKILLLFLVLSASVFGQRPHGEGGENEECNPGEMLQIGPTLTNCAVDNLDDNAELCSQCKPELAHFVQLAKRCPIPEDVIDNIETLYLEVVAICLPIELVNQFPFLADVIDTPDCNLQVISDSVSTCFEIGESPDPTNFCQSCVANIKNALPNQNDWCPVYADDILADVNEQLDSIANDCGTFFTDIQNGEFPNGEEEPNKDGGEEESNNDGGEENPSNNGGENPTETGPITCITPGFEMNQCLNAYVAETYQSCDKCLPILYEYHTNWLVCENPNPSLNIANIIAEYEEGCENYQNPQPTTIAPTSAPSQPAGVTATTVAPQQQDQGGLLAAIILGCVLFGIILYFTVGSLFNRYSLGIRGVEAIPHSNLCCTSSNRQFTKQVDMDEENQDEENK